MAEIKTVAAKLQIKPGTAVWVSDPGHQGTLQLPAEARVVDATEADVAVVFADGEAALRAELDRHVERLPTGAAVWIAYPKAGRADINRDSLWPILGEYGFRPVSQVAIDEVWSALRFRALRPGEVFQR